LPEGSEANVPPAEISRPGLEICNPGTTEKAPTVVPLGERTVPTPTRSEASLCAGTTPG
jgi:hypothetical protein